MKYFGLSRECDIKKHKSGLKISANKCIEVPESVQKFAVLDSLVIWKSG